MGILLFIPIGLLVAALVSFIKGYKQWTSGTTTTTMDPRGGPVTRTDSNKRRPWTSIGAFWFAILFLICAIGSFAWMMSER